MCRIDFGRIIMPDKYKKEQLQKRLIEAQKRRLAQGTTIAYQNDTVKTTYQNYQTNAYYENSTGRIVRVVHRGAGEATAEQIKRDVSHEAKHASNEKLGLPKVSAEQYYKLEALNEVSAHIVSTLCWRQEYLKAPDKKKFIEEEQNRSISSRNVSITYFEAIADGTINPESKDPKDFDKEMRILAQEQFEDMADRYSGYVRQFTNNTRGYMNTEGRDFKPNDAEFEKFSKHYMTIGGVDFRKYLDTNYQDQIYVPDEINFSSKNMEKNANADEAQVLASNGLVYDGTVSLEQYHKLLQHKVIASNVIYNIRDDKEKTALQSGSTEYDEDINSSYNLFKNHYSAEEMNRMIKPSLDLALNRANGNVPDNDTEFERQLKEIYTLPGTNVDLRSHMTDFDPDAVPAKENQSIEEFLKDPEKYKAEHPYKREFSKPLEVHTGDVEWASGNGASDVETMEIFNSEGDFLQAERESRELEQDIEEAEREEALKKEKEAEEKRKREEEQKKKEEEERKKQEEQQQQPEQPNQAQQQAQQGQAAEQNSPLQTEGENSFEGAGEASNESDTSSEESGASSAGENDNKQTAENSAPDNEYADKAGTIVTQRVEPLSTAPKPKSTPYRILDGFKGYFSSNSSPQYKNAEMKSTINQDGSRTDALYIDGKKHGAEISQDKNGEITDVKAYDHGKPMNLNGHKIDVRSDEKEINGKKIKTNQVALDGKPFGAVTAESSDGTVKADFYDKNGQRMSGAKGAKITKTTEYAPAASAQQHDQTQAAENTSKPQQSETRAQQQKPAQPTENQTAPAEAEQSQQRKTQPQEQTQTQAAGQQVEVSKPENYAHEVQDNMKKGHNRIAEMRAKLAAGHSEKLSAESEESPAEKLLREKRYESAHQSRKTVTPTRINAQQMESMLSAYEYK